MQSCPRPRRSCSSPGCRRCSCRAILGRPSSLRRRGGSASRAVIVIGSAFGKRGGTGGHWSVPFVGLTEAMRSACWRCAASYKGNPKLKSRRVVLSIRLDASIMHSVRRVRPPPNSQATTPFQRVYLFSPIRPSLKMIKLHPVALSRHKGICRCSMPPRSQRSPSTPTSWNVSLLLSTRRLATSASLLRKDSR